MSGYIGTQPVPQATQKRQAFTATAGQTSFATSGYSVGFVDVYMNGVKLAAADYTATNGSDVVLATAALVNDIVEIVAFTSFVASDGLAAANNLSDVASAATALTNLGVTSTAAELNLLDGVSGLVQADFTKLAAIDSTAAEINQLDAITRGSILYGNASGATARLAKGAAGTVLTSDGTDLSFAAVGASDVVWPSNFASPTNTYTSSGTWSKGSLADDDYVWIYLVGGGGGGTYDTGNFVNGGVPGAALLLYGKASLFNGGAYVIGAGNPIMTVAATPTTFTLSSANNSTLFTTGVNGGLAEGQADAGVFKIVEAKTSPITVVDVVVNATQSPTSIFTIPAAFPTIPNAYGTLYAWNAGSVGAYPGAAYNSVFGGGGGGGKNAAAAVGGGTASLYAANGSNFNSGGAAAVPGAGGCGGTSASGAQVGAAGNVRVYHV